MADLVLLSLGAGVQSTTLALMTAEGSLPKVDGAIFADTGWEPKRVYEHLARLGKVLAGTDVPLYRVSRGNLRDDVLSPHAHATIPAYVRGPNGERQVIGRRCTGRYKVEPIERQIRVLLGATVTTRDCRYCQGTGARVAPWDVDAGIGPCSVCRGTGQRQIIGSVPAGASAEQWIGFSTDEVHRVSETGFPSYVTVRYPLLDLGMSREDCERWLRDRGWTEVAKSACIGCPYSGNRQWRALRDTCTCGHHRQSHFEGFGPCRIMNPANTYGHGMCACHAFEAPEWDDAVAFDTAFRQGSGLDGQRFLHESRVPLSVAPIDHVTRNEWVSRQGSLFDLAEDGDPDGCSPYGCRSGVPVEVPSG